MPECPDTIEEFQELERMLPLCKVTLYNQAKSRIETGAAKSVSDAARQLADETGRKPGTIERAIRRTEGGRTLSDLTGTSKFSPKPQPVSDPPDDEWEPIYTGEDPAYCKYCYTSHFDWDLRGGFVGDSGMAWVCQRCDHATADENMNVRDAADYEDGEDEETEEWIKQTEKEILETAKQIKKENTHNHRAQGTGENEWYTPQEYIYFAIQVMGGIDTDPASSALANEKIKAEQFFSLEDDGLNREWHGRVWLNPPYAQPAISNFAKKMVAEWDGGRVQAAIVLTHNYTDTRWFHTLAGSCSAVCFTRGRIAFVNPEGEKAAPTQGQTFFYFGRDGEKFKEVFKEVGLVFFK